MTDIKIGYDMLRLCKSLLLGVKMPPDALAQINTDTLFPVCEGHCLTAMACTALEFNGITPDAKWTEAKAKAIRKNMLLDAERGQITAFLEKEHIWYMPLKGSVMKDYYPGTGMRQMSDNDILFDPSCRKTVKKYMKDRGYHLKSKNNNHCDEWVKAPVYNFEMHLNLFTPMQDITGYFTDIKKKLIGVSPNSFAYRFTDEDFYIYMTAHAYKHYSGGGTGLRTLIDYYLYLKNKESAMNWVYITDELKKLDINEFEAQIHLTAKKVFSPKSPLTDDERKMVRFMLGSGTYGNFENSIINMSRELKGENKAQYIFRRIFPNMAWMKMYAPTVAKYPVLYPFYLMKRFYRLLFVTRKQRIKELKIICKADDKLFQKEN